MAATAAEAAAAAALGVAGRYTEAETAYEALLALEPLPTPFRGELLVGLAEVYWKEGKWARAYERYRLAQPLLRAEDTESRARVHLRVGQVLMDSPLNRPQALEHLVAALQLGGEAMVAKLGGTGPLDLARTVVPPPPGGWALPLTATPVRTIDDQFMFDTVRTVPTWHTPRYIRDWQIEVPESPGHPLRVVLEHGKTQKVWVRNVAGEPSPVPVVNSWLGAEEETRFRYCDHDFILRVDSTSTLKAAFGRVNIELFCDGRSCERGKPYAPLAVSGAKKALHATVVLLVLVPIIVVPTVLLILVFYAIFGGSWGGIIIGGLLGATVGGLMERAFFRLVGPAPFLRYMVPAIMVMEPPPPWSPPEGAGSPTVAPPEAAAPPVHPPAWDAPPTWAASEAGRVAGETVPLLR